MNDEGGGPTVVAMDVPQRDSLIGGPGASEFACNFGFQQKVKDVNNLLIHPFYEDNGNRYIVQGSNSVDPINSVSIVEAGQISGLSSSELSDAVSQTDTGVSDPFQHFPTGSPRKHPKFVWEDEYE